MYLDLTMNDQPMTLTQNGALTHATTGEACLDFFSVAGGMRYRKPSEQIGLFDLAYQDSPDMAMKLLFHLRDIREGMGERKAFRTLLRHVAYEWPESARKNAEYVAEYGRWDDLLCLLKTPAHATAVQIIRKQLDEDLAAAEKREAGDDTAHISLLAKWLPSDNASSARTRSQAKKLYQALGMHNKDYRRMLTRLRKHIGLTERYLTTGHCEKIDYEAVPAHTMLRCCKQFQHHDGERFDSYLQDVKAKKKKIHADTLSPAEIIRPYYTRHPSSADIDFALSQNGGNWKENIWYLWWLIHHGLFIKEPEQNKVLELLWKYQYKKLQTGNNALSVVDISGSMYCYKEGEMPPQIRATAMALYCAEHCTGAFLNKVMTFDYEPRMVTVLGTSLADKLRKIQRLARGYSTDLEAVFDVILKTAVERHLSKAEMPPVVYIFSDMEFNQSSDGLLGNTVYDTVRKKYAAAGHEMPAVVFHNVNSWQMQAPVTADTRRTYLTSGISINSIRDKFDGNLTPMDHMLRVLNSKRYECIRA